MIYDMMLDGRIAKMASSVKLIATIAAAVFSTEAAQAGFFNRVATSGQTTKVYRYHSWNRDCQANGGVVKVLTKPKHGTLTPRSVDSQIKRSRFTGSTPCAGRPLKGFQVDYRSTPGFRGNDTFTIEVSFGNGRSDVDTFSIDVR